MIVVEDRFEEMIDVIPEMNNPNVSEEDSFKVKFSFGDSKELISYLINNKSDVYPLIWLVYPVSEEHTLKKVKMDKASFILAVRTNDSLSNKERFATNYKNVLIPLYNNFTELLERSNIVNIAEKINVIKYPNYSNEENSEENKTVDIWDAIKVTASLSITNAHFRKNIRFSKNILNNQ